MSQKYPLAALSTLRTAAAEQRAHAVALAEGPRLLALSTLYRVRQALEDALAKLRSSEAVAAGRLQAGLERAFDLELAADERRAQAQIIAELELGLARAEKELQRTEKIRDDALGALARAQAEQEVVDVHHGEWQRREALHREEQNGEEALDRWTSEHVKSGQK